MDNFNIRAYLAEGRLIKEEKDSTGIVAKFSKYNPLIDLEHTIKQVTFQVKSNLQDEDFQAAKKHLIDQGYEVNQDQSHNDYMEDDDRDIYPKIVFEKKPKVTNEGKSVKELETHIATSSNPDKREDGTYDMSSVGMKEDDVEENIGLADIGEIGYAAGEAAFEEIKGRFRNKPDHKAYRKGFFQGFTDNASLYGLNEDLDIGHEDNEPGMLKAELYHIGSYAMELYKMMDALEGQGEVDFPAWWQSKITTAKTMISGAKHYLEFELKEPAIDDMVDRLDGIAPEMEIDVVDDENMEESIDKEFHSTSNTNGHPDWRDKSAIEIQDYIGAPSIPLWGRELRTAEMVRDQKIDSGNTSLNDEAKIYFMRKVQRGEIDTLPEDPKAEYLAQMTRDQMDHDKETSHREGELEEDSFYTDDIKNKVVSKLMDQLKK